jgi:hypothetical protein
MMQTVDPAGLAGYFCGINLFAFALWDFCCSSWGFRLAFEFKTMRYYVT